MRFGKYKSRIFSRPAKAVRRLLCKYCSRTKRCIYIKGRSHTKGHIHNPSHPDCHEAEDREPRHGLELSRDALALPTPSEYAKFSQNPFQGDDNNDDDKSSMTACSMKVQGGKDDDVDSAYGSRYSDTGSSGTTLRGEEEGASLAFNVHQAEYSVLFQRAKHVMDRHFLGPLHGLPLSALSAARAEAYPGGFLVNQQWRARIIEGQLFLAARYEIKNMCLDRNLRKFIDSHTRTICPHVRTHNVGREDSVCTTRIPELDTARLHGDYRYHHIRLEKDRFPGFVGEMRACRFCPTDYCVRVYDKGPIEGFMVSISTWHRLGRCRSPEDVVWQRFVSGAEATWRSRARIRYAHRDDPVPPHEAGSIRRKYEGSTAGDDKEVKREEAMRKKAMQKEESAVQKANKNPPPNARRRHRSPARFGVGCR
ncbi:uncharacterized protein K452DRAFT_322765 [Aplosporella prunicola CBS 121167]|uniref:Uncharacterized protein n=1 Tax=Aplosporella prunicola CBS 121167 TaxID=1176127 RepID=A0A6A6AVE3_9PEZI|nr:uncharacterized protein K452DRAFT_322765 [Aplosporella prunicola CBS 121167]KAF2135909.1 hypothetical protein K452DRAFT_322765 [Aplosporella prunicola CBS 121167]